MIYNLKQITIRLVTVFALLMLVTITVNAQPVKSANTKTIDYIDNTKGIVVIGDHTFHLKLNTKVSDNKKRPLNRYALRVGQSVKYNSFYENKVNYVDSILIVSN